MEMQGIWWIEDELHCNKGKCYFIDGAIYLDIEGDPVNILLQIPYNSCIKFIYGKLTDGKYCTLFHCTPISESIKANGQDTKKIKCEVLIKGGCVDNDQTYKSSSCRIVYTGLRAWMELKPLGLKRNQDGIFVKYTYPTSNRFFINPVKSHFDLLYYVKSEFVQGERITLGITPYIEITPNVPQNIHWYIDICNKLNQFLSLLIGFDLACSCLAIENKDHRRNTVNNLEYLEIITPNILNFSPSTINGKGPVFISYKDVLDNLQQLLVAWFNIYSNFESPIELFYQSIQNNTRTKWTFLNLIFATEKIYDLIYDSRYIDKKLYTSIYKELKITIDKIGSEELKHCLSIKIKAANKYSLQSKLYTLLNEAKKILTDHVSDSRKLASNIARMRNSLAHGRIAQNDQRKYVDDIDSINMTLKNLIAYNLFKQIGLDDTFLENKFSTTYIPPYG